LPILEVTLLALQAGIAMAKPMTPTRRVVRINQSILCCLDDLFVAVA
jgi:hypothetical protein